MLRWTGYVYHFHVCDLSGNHVDGRIELRNRDPLMPPLYDPRFGASDEDNRELVDCIKVAISHSLSFASLTRGRWCGKSWRNLTRNLSGRRPIAARTPTLMSS